MSAPRQFLLLLAVSACCLLTSESPLRAGKYNPVLDVGDQAPTWDKLPATDGKSYSSDSFQDKQVLVIAFTCNSCLYAVDYEDRLNQLAKKYSTKDSPVAVIAVNARRQPGKDERTGDRKAVRVSVSVRSKPENWTGVRCYADSRIFCVKQRTQNCVHGRHGRLDRCQQSQAELRE